MSELKERKPDGGLADLIEFYEEMGGEDDGEMLVLLLELRAFRRTRDKERERIAELEAELAHRDAAAGEPVAVVGSDFSLFWAGSGPIAPLIERHNIKVGAKLYTTPPDGWIKCSERMPDDDTLCLGCDLDGVMWTLHFDEGQLMPDIGELSSAITHWMPLPAAPGGDE
jgi:hypothetical protein